MNRKITMSLSQRSLLERLWVPTNLLETTKGTHRAYRGEATGIKESPLSCEFRITKATRKSGSAMGAVLTLLSTTRRIEIFGVFRPMAAATNLLQRR